MPDLVGPELDGATFFAGEQPRLDGDGLSLRPWQDGDWPAVHRAYADPDIRRWHMAVLDEDEARGWAEHRNARWRHRTGVDWAIVDGGAGGPVLGRIAIRRFELNQALGEVAYWVLPEARGAGVTARALEAVCAWAFARKGLHRLELMHSAGNPASCRVAERSGFVLEGVKRRELRHTDGWHDMHLHARLADDPAPPRSPARSPDTPEH